MAIVSLSAVTAALSQQFEPRLAKAMNRECLISSLLTKAPGSGKNLGWDAQFSGASVETFNDGADASTFDSDLDVPATLDWGRYRSNFSLSGTAQAAAASSQSPEDLLNLVLDKAEGSSSKLLSGINSAIFAGSGATNVILGLASGLAASGSYANIDPGTYTEWVSTVNANGSVPRPLTKELMDSMERAISKASGVSPNCIVTTFEVASKFEGLFDSSARYTGPGADLSVLAGVGSSAEIPEVMSRSLMGFYKGIPVFRDKDCTAGTMYFLNLNEVKLRFLPKVKSMTSVIASPQALKGNEKDSGLFATLESLAHTGDADKFSVLIYPQLQIRKRNAHGKLSDILES